MEVMYDDNVNDISLNYESVLFLNNEQLLKYVEYKLRRKKSDGFKVTIERVVSGNFKKFIENVEDLYRKYVISESARRRSF